MVFEAWLTAYPPVPKSNVADGLMEVMLIWDAFAVVVTGLLPVPVKSPRIVKLDTTAAPRVPAAMFAAGTPEPTLLPVRLVTRLPFRTGRYPDPFV